MRRSSLTAGLAAAFMLAGAVVAAEAKMKQDVTEDIPDVELGNASQQIAAARQFLALETNLAKLKLPKLQQRLHRAEDYRSVPGLPPDLDAALQQEITRITREIVSRGPAEPLKSPMQ